MMNNSHGDSVIKVESLGKYYKLGYNEPLIKSIKTIFNKNYFRDEKNEKGFWALKDISFEVKRGEVVGIIGHNGAGKSTLLKILSRITDPTSGYAEINGRLAALLEVGTGMHPDLTGKENIFMNGTILGMKKFEIEKNFDGIVDFSGVAKFLDTPVKHYSSGMRVRLGFAIAAYLEPEILIVDEVLAVGDAAFQARCLDKMQDVATGGRTVLFVSHNMAAMENLCSKSILLEKGRLIFEGSTPHVISKYIDDLQSVFSVALVERTDRRGNGYGKFINISLMTDNLQRINAISSGQNIIISLEYLLIESVKVQSVDIHITFFTTQGQFLFNCSTISSGSNLVLVHGENSLSCMIKRFPLVPGNYYFNLYSTINGIEADWIQRAGKVTVIEGDFFGTGKIVSHSDGFLVENKWFNSPVAVKK